MDFTNIASMVAARKGSQKFNPSKVAMKRPSRTRSQNLTAVKKPFHSRKTSAQIDYFSATPLQMESNKVHLQSFDSGNERLETDYTDNIMIKTKSPALTSVNEA